MIEGSRKLAMVRANQRKPIMRRFAILTSTAALVLGASCASSAPARSPEQVAMAALAVAPVWDGHNDVPEQLRERR